jgi:TonB family protein
MANQNTFKDKKADSVTEDKNDRSLLYMCIALGAIILVMGYLTFYVDDVSTLFSGDDDQIALVGDDQKALLNKNSEMSDEEVKTSLIKFIDAFYRDQRNGYFDPPSYFASITNTYYNFHNLTYNRLKQLHKKRSQEMLNLELDWIVSSLDYVRKDQLLEVTYWTHIKYFKRSGNTEETADIKNEIIIDKEGKIISLREVETKNLTSYLVDNSTDSLGGEETGYIGPGNETLPVSDQTTADANDSKIYDAASVETNPEFSGGQKALANFIASTLKYPAKATEDKVSGKVTITFVIEKNGTLSDFHVVKGIGSGCDEEALRVIKASPLWKPGTIQNQAVRTSISLPINFQLLDN